MTKASEIVERMKDKKFEVSLLSEEGSPCKVTEWISTGCLALDVIMGGGLPVGRYVEIYGDPSSGKSLIAAQVAAVAQEQGYTVVYVDTETAVSIDMLKKIGVNVDDLIYASPDTVEEVFKFFEEAIDIKHSVDPDGIMVFIWDSIAATSSRDEMTKDYGQLGYPSQARIISQSLRKITHRISEERIAALFLNQTRKKLGVMFGDDVATFGGGAVSFYASVRVALRLSNKIKIAKKKGNIVGMNTKAVVVKSKVGIPYREATLPIYFGSAIDDAKASLMWLKEMDYITMSGSWHHLMIGDEDIKFQAEGWEKVYDEHFEDISNTMLESVDGSFVIGDEEETVEEAAEE